MTAFYVPAPIVPPAELTVTSRVMAFAPGLYVLKVRGGGAPALAPMMRPFVQLSEAPGNPQEAEVEMMSALAGHTLSHTGDTLVVKVTGAPARLLLTSFRPADQPHNALALEVQRLDGDVGPMAGGPASTPIQRVLPLEVMVHVQSRGDLRFAESAWAGCGGQQLWIEAFAVLPSETLSAQDIEYKALTANGWETPWVQGGDVCGSRGHSIPLLGFALRLRGAAAERYECLCEASFFSGSRVGPLQGGALCRSDVIGDPLDGILIRIIERARL